jgi:hypothetical protein
MKKIRWRMAGGAVLGGVIGAALGWMGQCAGGG